MPSSRLCYFLTTLIPSSVFLSAGVAASLPSPCTSLSTVLPAQVFFPGTEGYNTSISSYRYVQTRLLPACIVKPRYAQNVSKIVEILGRHNSTRFAIRGGGHNVNPGFANIENGVTIDMRDMNTVDISRHGEVVEVGAGALWGHVYDVVEQRGLSILGGRVASVGVGGLTTGGGISYLSPKRGWVCDSVKNFEVVLSNSSIVNANATSESSLFAALKGGQNNFGIVTRFDLKTFPQGPIWGGTITLSNASDTALLRAFTMFKDPSSFDPHAHVIIIFMYDVAQQSFFSLNNMWHSKPNGSKKALQGLLNVGPQINNTIGVAYAGEYAKISVMPVPQNARSQWATTTFAISPTILFRVHKIWRSASIRLGQKFQKANLVSSYTIQSVPPPPPGSRPNSLGFSPYANPEKDLVNFLVLFQYEDPKATQELQDSILGIINEIDKIAEVEGIKQRFKYLNYAHWHQDILGSYGQASLQRMQKVAKKYDPVGMFQNQVVGGFKLAP
ncbi:FAD-binding domain-containing protein [Lojkania enalia]|uniref:FAD-binding domain-containing protein n=1 Tax=Lojkania enalia TaxID=147567 RepID=A0A9P4NAU1_9PLEO|nr:FAD-binding domain-containing protein [Didymosphaeria enalia]